MEIPITTPDAGHRDPDPRRRGRGGPGGSDGRDRRVTSTGPVKPFATVGVGRLAGVRRWLGEPDPARHHQCQDVGQRHPRVHGRRSRQPDRRATPRQRGRVSPSSSSRLLLDGAIAGAFVTTSRRVRRSRSAAIGILRVLRLLRLFPRRRGGDRRQDARQERHGACGSSEVDGSAVDFAVDCGAQRDPRHRFRGRADRPRDDVLPAADATPRRPRRGDARGPRPHARSASRPRIAPPPIILRTPDAGPGDRRHRPARERSSTTRCACSSRARG